MKSKNMLLPILVSIALVLALIVTASAAGASSVPLSVTDDDSVSCSTMDGSGLASVMVLNTPEGEVTPMVAAGWNHIVGLRADGAVLAAGYNDLGQCAVRGWADIDKVAAGLWHTVGLKSDGTVVAVGYNSYGQCEVGGWTDIIQIAAGIGHTLGLKDDGAVVAMGNNLYGQCNVGNWTNINQVAAGYQHTVGLKSNGTVVAVGLDFYGQCNVGNWTNVNRVAAGIDHTVGVKSDGTMVAVGWNNLGQCNVGGWTDIIQVAADFAHTVGLKDDGTVVAVGYNGLGQCNVLGWRNIIQVAAGGEHTVGLKDDGTVVAVGRSLEGQCYVADWSNIIQVAAGTSHTVGLKSDGTMVAVGGEVELPEWNLYETPERRYTLTIFSTPGGSVTEPEEGTHTYDEGIERNLVAVPEEDYRFVCWAGDVGTIADVYTAQTTITMNDDYSITARFTAEVDSKTETVSDGTVNATDEANTEVEVTGNATVTVVQFADNPGGYSPTGFNSLDNYIDVYVPYVGEVTEVEIRLYYTDAELAAASIDEESLQLFWWDGAEWSECSNSGVNTTSTDGYSGYIWAIITEDTTPSLEDLQGTPFSGYGLPSGGCFIATAAYGTDTARQLDILREFRDEVLLPSSLGAEFVSLYYKTSPPIADFISQHEVLRTVVKVGFVDPIVKILNWSHGLWSARSS